MKTRLLFLVPLFILVYFFVHNITDFFYFLEGDFVIKTVLKYILAVSILYFIGFFFFGNKEKFTLQFSSVLFIFLFFGSFIDMADNYIHFDISGGFYSKLSLILLVSSAAIILLTTWLNKATILRLLKFWVIYCVVLCIYDTGSFILFAKKQKKYLTAPTELTINPAAQKPCIFFFLFDMYPSDSVFKKYLYFDNSQLSTFLKQKDFFVTGNAHSLYDATYYSLCSTLNLESLNFYEDSTLKEYQKRLIALKKSEHSTLLNAFEKAGYIFKNFSVLDLQGQPSPLKFNLHYHIGNVLTSTTFFNRLYNNIEPDFILSYRNIDLGFFKESWSSKVKKDIATLDVEFNKLLDSVSTSHKPGFNYFHFMIPHPPVIYDSTGKENSVKNMYSFSSFEKNMAYYTSYTKYGNNKIKQMVNSIFEKIGKNVIIIIQGDHGYREEIYQRPAEARYGILNAVYLPSKNYSNFYDSINPINTFKQVLLNQFNTIAR